MVAARSGTTRRGGAEVWRENCGRGCGRRRKAFIPSGSGILVSELRRIRERADQPGGGGSRIAHHGERTPRGVGRACRGAVASEPAALVVGAIRRPCGAEFRTARKPAE